jgi:hypothetical protein
VEGNVLKWFDDYLNDRTQSVAIGANRSEPKSVKYGVPQGSVLGPLLFIIFFTPIGKEIEKYELQYKLYADDILIHTSCKSHEIDSTINKIEQCCANLSKWLSKSSLVLNPNKTEFLIVGTPQQIKKVSNKKIYIDGTPIHASQSVRYLGFELDQTLSYDKQIGKVCKKANGNLRILYRQIRFMNIRARKVAVDSLVGSLIDYCIVLYNKLPKKKLKRLERLLNSMRRFTEGVKKEPTDKKWLTVEQKIQMRFALITKAAVTGFGPDFLNELLVPVESSHNLRSISKGDLKIVRTSTSIAGRAFRVTAPKIWNNLSPNLRNKTSYGSFRENLLHEL